TSMPGDGSAQHVPPLPAHIREYFDNGQQPTARWPMGHEPRTCPAEDKESTMTLSTRRHRRMRLGALAAAAALALVACTEDATPGPEDGSVPENTGTPDSALE